MKKSLKVLVLVIALVVITGCGNNKEKEVVKSCKLNTNDVINGYKLEAEYNIYGKDKVVDKVITVETVISDNDSVLDLFEKTLDKTYSALNEAYGGYTNKLTRKDGKLISETTVDYSFVDLKQYVEYNPILKDFVTSDNKLLISGIEEIYEAMGAVCN